MPRKRDDQIDINLIYGLYQSGSHRVLYRCTCQVPQSAWVKERLPKSVVFDNEWKNNCKGETLDSWRGSANIDNSAPLVLNISVGNDSPGQVGARQEKRVRVPSLCQLGDTCATEFARELPLGGRRRVDNWASRRAMTCRTINQFSGLPIRLVYARAMRGRRWILILQGDEKTCAMRVVTLAAITRCRCALSSALRFCVSRCSEAPRRHGDI